MIKNISKKNKKISENIQFEESQGFNRPGDFPDWCMTKNENLAKYPQEKTTDGWLVGEVPPREWENYFKNLVAKWTRYLDNEVSKIRMVQKGIAIPTFPSLCEDAYNCTATTKADENGFVLCNGQTIDDPTAGKFHGVTIPNLNNNIFIKGNEKDNLNQGNKNKNSVDIDHTHNYSHTHAVMSFSLQEKAESKNYMTFDFQKTPNKDKELLSDLTIEYLIQDSDHQIGTSNSVILVTAPRFNPTILYTSGVYGDSVNGITENASTSLIEVESKKLVNIEPGNITAIYIMRIK